MHVLQKKHFQITLNNYLFLPFYICNVVVVFFCLLLFVLVAFCRNNTQNDTDSTDNDVEESQNIASIAISYTFKCTVNDVDRNICKQIDSFLGKDKNEIWRAMCNFAGEAQSKERSDKCVRCVATWYQNKGHCEKGVVFNKCATHILNEEIIKKPDVLCNILHSS